MKLRRCFSLLLAVLLALSCFGFSATKAWAADTYFPDLPNALIPTADNAYLYSVSGGVGSAPWQATGSFDGTPGVSVDVPAGTWAVGAGVTQFTPDYTLPVQYSGAFGYAYDSAFVPVAVKLVAERRSNRHIYAVFDADLHQVDSTCYWTYDYDGSAPEAFTISRVLVYFSAPSSSNVNVLGDASYAGTPYDVTLYYSGLRWRSVKAPSADEQYQSSVTSGISKVKDTVQKGFDKVTTAVKGIGSTVSGAVDAVGEKVTELKESVVEKTTEIKESIVEKTDEVKETITQETEKLGNFLLDGLKDLFIPSEDYFSQLFERLNKFFSDRFGFLYFPIEHFITLCNNLMNLPEQEPSIAIPELSYEGEIFIPAQTYTFDFLSEEPFKTVHDYYLLAIDASLIMSFVSLLQRKYQEVMAN